VKYRVDPAPEVVDWLLLSSHQQEDVRERVQRKFYQAFRYISMHGPATGRPHLGALHGYRGVYEVRVEDTVGWFRLFGAFGRVRPGAPTVFAVGYALKKLEKNPPAVEYRKAAEAVRDYLKEIDE
jgi:hypothetical protein